MYIVHCTYFGRGPVILLHFNYISRALPGWRKRVQIDPGVDAGHEVTLVAEVVRGKEDLRATGQKVEVARGLLQSPTNKKEAREKDQQAIVGGQEVEVARGILQ